MVRYFCISAWQKTMEGVKNVEVLKKIISRVVACMMVVTLVTCGHVNKGVAIEAIHTTSSPNRTIYLVGGCSCKTVSPFNFMLGLIQEDDQVFLVEYQDGGFDLDLAAETLRQHINDNRVGEVVIISISMGYQLSARVSDDTIKEIAICPCPGKEYLQPRLQKLGGTLPTLRVAANIVFGDLLYLPLYPVADGWESYKLLLDQFNVASTPTKVPASPEAVILATRDGVINNEVILSSVDDECRVYYVETQHFGVIQGDKTLFRAPMADELLRH